MFAFSILIGVYTYLIFFLGILGWLYVPLVVGVSVVFWGIVGIVGGIRGIRRMRRVRMRGERLFFLFVGLFVLQAGVNLIGVLGPERGFDALWYHLTLPKLYLDHHSIFFIPGGLLYYSAMPKLAEMLYVGGLALGGETIPKLIHFSFGILTCIALYKLSRKFFNPLISIIAVVIFYSNLVVGWESITAYVDLTRAFFEVMALWAFINWWPPSSKASAGQGKWLVLSALMVGLAITTKLLAVGSLFIFLGFIMVRGMRRNGGIGWIRDVGNYVWIALVVPLAWLVFSYINTGNPVYPFFSEIYNVTPEAFSIIGFVRDVGVLFTQSSDPISVIYVSFLPIVLWMFLQWKVEGIKKIWEVGVVGIYSLFALIVWYFTPRTGGGRFIIPYLPAFSILCAAVIQAFWKNKIFSRMLVGLVIVVSLFSIAYRLAANWKYVPVILGQETKQEFLTNNLNFSYGDFYDVDGYFKNNIRSNDRVLLYGFHNIYYVDFPFVDASWGRTIRYTPSMDNDNEFNYIATQNVALPEKFKQWKLVYTNERTMVKLYRR